MSLSVLVGVGRDRERVAQGSVAHANDGDTHVFFCGIHLKAGKRASTILDG